MRIPLEQTDLQYFLGRITPKLQAAWPEGQLPAIPFEDAVARFLGYEDHLTLLDCVGEWSAFEETPISREGLKEAILWNGFAAGLLSYFKLLEIFPADDLKYLSADRFTDEGRAEAIAEEQEQIGSVNDSFPFIMDEFGLYGSSLRGNWLKETPELLDAGAPPYELALLCDGRGFSFQRLRKKFRQLPSDLDKKIGILPGYGKLSEGARRQRYFKEHLIPEAFTGALEAVSGYDKQPDGVRILHVGGAYRIFNDHLGGMIPYKFLDNSDRIHLARIMIMRGQPVHFDEGFSEVEDDGCRHELTAEKLDDCKLSNAAEDLRVINYLSGINLGHTGESHLLPVGNETFVEAGQVYIRSNTWLDKASVPAVLSEAMLTFPDKPSGDTQEAFPAWSKAFHEHLLAVSSGVTERAQKAILEALSSGVLIKLAKSLVQYSSVSVNDYISNRILIAEAEILAEREEEDRLADDPPNQDVEVLEHCRAVGERLVRKNPELNFLRSETLGWAYFYTRRIDPSSLVAKDPDIGSDAQIVSSLICCLIYIQNLLVAGGQPKIFDSLDKKLLMISVEQLLILLASSGSGRPLTQVQSVLKETMNITSLHDEVARFYDELDDQKKQVAALNSFREQMVEIELSRSEGVYQFVHNPVSRVDDSFFATMSREGRKYGGVLVTQTMGDLCGTTRSGRSVLSSIMRKGARSDTKRLKRLTSHLTARPKKLNLEGVGSAVISSVKKALSKLI